jgi:UDP-N-acetylmuramoyl-tripeptide--D-alanyl-D-alanine ligase
MINTLARAAASMNGTLHGDDRQFTGVSTDTRSLRADELFFALEGPNFDGLEYVDAAGARGAAGAVVKHTTDAALAQIAVDDTRLALGRLAAAWREELPAKIVGVTGSNGKTTVKELIKACLQQQGPTFATRGNFNNDIGMPLMLVRIKKEHRFAVLEMGANHAGEIAYLASIARPDVAVITNAAAAHLEGFGSLDGVSQAKGEILQGLGKDGVAVLNADDDYFSYWASQVGDGQVVSFGLDAGADVRAVDIETSTNGSSFKLQLPDAEQAIALPLVGTHNVRNACAAAAVAHVCGVASAKIKTALESVVPVSGRLQPLTGCNGATLFDDSYNANPVSVVAAAEFLASLPGENWLVLGDMMELGDDAAGMHRAVGEAARDCGIDRLYVFGELSRNTVEGFGEHASWYRDADALIDDVSAALTSSVNVLVKGSRSMRMELIVEALRERAAARKKA